MFTCRLALPYCDQPRTAGYRSSCLAILPLIYQPTIPETTVLATAATAPTTCVFCIKSVWFQKKHMTIIGPTLEESFPQLTTMLEAARCCSACLHYCFTIRIAFGNAYRLWERAWDRCIHWKAEDPEGRAKE